MLKKLKQLFLISSAGIILTAATYTHANNTETEEESDFQWFSAISLIGGLTESSSFDGEGNRDDDYDEFLSINLELHLEWKGFFFEQPGLSQQRIDGQFSNRAGGYRFYTNEHWDFEALVIQATNRLESEFVSPTESFIVERRSDVRAGIRANGFYDNYFVQAIWTPLGLRDEIDGNQFSLSIRRDWQIKNLNLYASVGGLYRSDDIMNFYYSVSTDLSKAILDLAGSAPEFSIDESLFAPFEAGGGTVFSAQAGFEYPLSEHWVAGGILSHQRLPSGISNSPLGSFSNNNSAAALSLTYIF